MRLRVSATRARRGVLATTGVAVAEALARSRVRLARQDEVTARGRDQIRATRKLGKPVFPKSS